MINNSQIKFNKASVSELIVAAKTSSTGTLDALAKDIAKSVLQRSAKIAIFSLILTNKKCSQETIKYILSLKEYEKVEIFDEVMHTSLREYALDKAPYIAPNTIKYLYENGGLYPVCKECVGLLPEMIINHFKKIDQDTLAEIMDDLRLCLPVNQFKKLPLFAEYIIIGLAKNTKLNSYQIAAFLEFIYEFIISKPLFFSAGNRKEMFYGFALNEKTGKDALNYLAAIDDEKIREAILAHPNASKELKQTIRELKVV